MAADAYRRFMARIHQQAGQSLRAVLQYDTTSWELLYLRDELRNDALQEAIPNMVDRLRDRTFVTTDEYDRLGEPLATVEVHTDAVLLHFREAADSGVIVTLDRAVAERVSTFIEDCANELP